MKRCKIHFLKALAGDCFVLEFANKQCIIIDCGYKTTYKMELKPLLIELNTKGCVISLLIITHTDRDHIEGAIEFIKDNGNSTSPRIIPIENIWYNGIYNTLCFNPEIKKRFGFIPSAQQNVVDYYLAQLISQLPDSSSDISANNCIGFEQICIKNKYKINSCFSDGFAIRTFNSCKEKYDSSFQIGDCKITVLSPSNNEIMNLSVALHHDLCKAFGSDYIIDRNSKFIKLCELLLELSAEVSNIDETISDETEKIESWLGTSRCVEMNHVNKASIVVEVQFDNLKMLFTGDSESLLWCEWLDDYYDVIKLSHHGTTKPNIKMLEKTKGNIALISTNGYHNHQHPEKDMIARAILSGYNVLYFNYAHPFKDVLINGQSEYGYEVHFEQTTIEL